MHIVGNSLPKGYIGSTHADARGIIKFVNTWKMKDIKRFYVIELTSLSHIRAFHGHMKEAKYVFVIRGSILLCIVRLDKHTKPSKRIDVKRIILQDTIPQIFVIPPGYANGFKSLTQKCTVLFFSSLSLKDSTRDDYRFPYDYWGKEIWDETDKA